MTDNTQQPTSACNADVPVTAGVLFFQAEDGIRDIGVTGVQTCALPISYWTMLIGAISSAGIPGFAGFFSKDAIIEAVRHSSTPGHLFAWLCVLSRSEARRVGKECRSRWSPHH